MDGIGRWNILLLEVSHWSISFGALWLTWHGNRVSGMWMITTLSRIQLSPGAKQKAKIHLMKYAPLRHCRRVYRANYISAVFTP
jgi:hypothetical protein